MASLSCNCPIKLKGDVLHVTVMASLQLQFHFLHNLYFGTRKRL